MAISRVRMFAGPNGSGKSDLIFWLQQSDLPLGPIVNADIIFDELQNAGFIDLQEFELSGVSQNDWNSALNEIGELSSRVEQAGILPNVEIKEDMLICDGNDLNVYVAAMVSDFVRYMMVN